MTLPDRSLRRTEGFDLIDLIAAAILFLGIGAGLGILAAHAGLVDDQPCEAGQVYVVDTGECTDATDHTGHLGQ